jgi:hypothetical protein
LRQVESSDLSPPVLEQALRLVWAREKQDKQLLVRLHTEPLSTECTKQCSDISTVKQNRNSQYDEHE